MKINYKIGKTTHQISFCRKEDKKNISKEIERVKSDRNVLLIYDVKIDEFNNIKILMTLTTVNCPVADSFPLEVAKKTNEIEGIGQVAVKLTFEPSWNKDMMSEDARLALGY